MALKNQFEVAESGFPIGANGAPISLYQETIGRPVTGVWSEEDEAAYLDHLNDQMWQVLRISQKGRFPKNWEFTSEV